MTTAEKYMAIAANNETIAENVPKVYNSGYTAGKKSMVDESKLIPKTVSGSYISVDDVSEIPHTVHCKVESVNLFDTQQWYDEMLANPGNTSYAISKGIEDEYDYIKVHPASVSVRNGYLSNVFKPNTQYTLSVVAKTDTVGATGIQLLYVDGGAEAIRLDSLDWKSYSVTSSAGRSIKSIGIVWNNNGWGYYSNIMLNEGTTPLPYTPYVSPESVRVTRTGKNIVDILNGATRYKTVTIREKTENTIVLSCTGTYKGVCYILPKNLVGKYLTVSGEWDNANGAKGGLRINWIKANNAANAIGTQIWAQTSGVAVSDLVTPPTEEDAFLGLMVYGNSSGSIDGEGVVSYRNIQIEIGDKATDYEPYNGQTLTPSSDGTVEGMTSVSPYMNIFTDTEGVNIEATYNKSYGMQTEYDRFWDAFQKKGTLTNYICAFGGQWTPETFKPKYPIKPTRAFMLFYNNYSLALKIPDFVEFCKENNIVLDFSECEDAQYALACLWTNHFGVLDFSKCTGNSSLSYLFYSHNNETYGVKKIDEFKSSANTVFNSSSTNSGTFYGATYLSDIKMSGVVAKSINFGTCPLNKASIESVVNVLSDTATGQALTLKLSAVNTAFETSSGAADGSTSAEFAALVATKSNWTITMV